MEGPLKVQMTASQRGLWERISRYTFDTPGTAYPFVERLAEENGWPLGYALRVEEEYRRFAFLAVSAGHPVSPPDTVDQAWHLHQLYSDSYWEDFCNQTLGTAFSHHPTKGGAAEQNKFADWYKLTTESYVRFFGQPPPTDIWPPVGPSISQEHDFARVDRKNNWVFPKAKFWTLVMFLGLLGITTGVLALVGTVTMGGSVLNAQGPDFLGFYLFSFMGLLVLAFILVSRAKFRPGSIDINTVHPYEFAYLNGGRQAVVHAAIARLMKDGCLRREAGGDTFATGDARLENAHPIEERIISYTQNRQGGCTAFSLLAAVKVPTAALANRLEAAQLLLSAEQHWRIRALVLGLFGGLALLGINKILTGLSRSKPVFFLMMLTALTMVGCIVYCVKMSRRTSLGKEILTVVKDRCRSLADWSRQGRMEPVGADVALMVGVLGLSTLPAVGMTDLRRTLAPPSQGGGDGGSGGSGCSSSDGGGGDGGGGGCGGCGGGGCGGG
ncbi:MAG: hypothetical protein K0Q55_2193 [Verrucomicrobia bacterium]|jgi:uncharacterized protein (TIGR04222 family)|nr:hypothetical protein [Verrucomicrobiota bacterium]